MSDIKGKSGRPPGSKNKFPSHSKIQDELRRHNFDILEKITKLYEKLESRHEHNECTKILLGMLDYVFPKRKPEDGIGDAGETPLIGLQVTDAQLTKLVEAAKPQ